MINLIPSGSISIHSNIVIAIIAIMNIIAENLAYLYSFSLSIAFAIPAIIRDITANPVAMFIVISAKCSIISFISLIYKIFLLSFCL